MLSLERVVKKYLTNKQLSRGTKAQYASTLRKWHAWGRSKPFNELERKDIRDFLDWVHQRAIALEGTNPGRTANKVRENLRAIMAWAWEHDLIDVLPRFPSRYPQRDVAGRHYLTKSEINSLYFATYQMARPRGWRNALPVGHYWRCALVVFFNYGVDTGSIWQTTPVHEPILWRHVFWNSQCPDREVKQRSRWGWIYYRRTKTSKSFVRPMNRVVHAHLKSMQAFPFELEGLKKTGKPFRVAEGMFPTISKDGTLVFEQETDQQVMGQAVWVDREGSVIDRLGKPQLGLYAPQISPDESLLTYLAPHNRRMNLWKHNIGLKSTDRIGEASSYSWFPLEQRTDDARLAMLISEPSRGLNEPGRILRIFPDSDGVPEELVKARRHWVWSMSSDGQFAFFMEKEEGEPNVVYLALDGSSQFKPLDLDSGERERAPELSPDGRYLAYVKDGVYISEVTRTESRISLGKTVKVSEGREPRWNPQGGELFYLERSGLLISRPMPQKEGGLDFRNSEPEQLFDIHKSNLLEFRSAGGHPTYQVSDDGSRFLFVQDASETALQQVKLQAITVVQNVSSELRIGG